MPTAVKGHPTKPTAPEFAEHSLHVAAFQIYKRHKLLRIEPGREDRGFAQFIFDLDDTLQQDRRDYFAGLATVEPRGLLDILVSLKRQAISITRRQENVLNDHSH